MNVGDPKKAAVLGAVALVVVGIAVFQALPKGLPKGTTVAQATQPPATSDDTPKSTGPVTEKLDADPFAHPKLVDEKAKNANNAGQASPQQTGSQPTGSINRQPPADWRPPYRFDPDQIQGEGGGDNTGLPDIDPATGKPRTSGNTGNSQESQKEVKKGQFVVEGIINVDKAKAFISIDGAEAKAFKAGEKIGSLGKITRITDNEVVIERDGKKYTVAVGKKVEF